MIEFEGKKFLNEQEAYLYCLEQIKIIKQSLGNALPDPIQGPQGDTGADGPRGPQGPRGTGLFGCTATLPSATAYQEGDMYLLFNGQLYKKINGSWIMQTTLKGPQGPVGLTGGTEVVANPVGSPTDNLEKINIDGTIYEVITTVDRNKLGLITYIGGNYILTTPILISSNLTTAGTIYNNGTIDSTSGNIKFNFLSQIKDSFDNPLVICENFRDSHNNARFVENNINTKTITGVTFTYAKWSLSGSHLMIVLAGTVANGTSLSYANWVDSLNIPNFIKNKIAPTFSDVVDIKSTTVYKSDWSGIDIGFVIYKDINNDIVITQYTDQSFDYTGQFRIQFDLLIDMA